MASGKAQICAPPSVSLTREAFGPSSETALWWLTGAGFLINAHSPAHDGDPAVVIASIREVERRVRLLAPGEQFVLRGRQGLGRLSACERFE